jgi:hypothetical protein
MKKYSRKLEENDMLDEFDSLQKEFPKWNIHILYKNFLKLSIKYRKNMLFRDYVSELDKAVENMNER